MNKYYSPLRYPGGKSCIFPFVSHILKENNIIGIDYAEPYAGGAGLALKLLFNNLVETIHINDYDISIYEFWKAILTRTDDFCAWIDDLVIDIDNWKKYKEVQKSKLNTPGFELAKATFFLNRTNISGIIKGGLIGGINQNGKYKINARFNKADLIERIQRIYTRRESIFVSNLDGVAFINKMNRNKKNVFVYLDPPYYQKGAELYMNYYFEKDHVRLAKNIKKLNKKWMVSYDNQDFITNLYRDKKKIVHKLSQSTSNRIGDEIIIFADSISFYNSTSILKNAVAI